MTLSEAERAYVLALSRLERATQPEARAENFELLHRAAEAGYAPAQFAYANALDYLRGDLLAALPWFLAAARQGHAEAHHRLRELYAHREPVRRRMSELMSAQELRAMQLREANFLLWFFGREEGYNSHFGRFMGVLVGLGIACPLAWYNLADLVDGCAGSRPWAALWEGMLVRQAGLYFGLCFVVGCIVDWLRPGSAGESRELLSVFSLLLLHITASLLLWGGYELCHAARSSPYWWLPGAAAALGGAAMALLSLLQLAHWCAARPKRSSL